MPGQKKISLKQTELLVNFVEVNKNISLKFLERRTQGSQMSRKIWKTLAKKLNSVVDGTRKTPQQWQGYWIDLKTRTKAKAVDCGVCRRQEAVTGAVNNLIPLNYVEKRVLAYIAMEEKFEAGQLNDSSNPSPEIDNNIYEECIKGEMSLIPGSYAVYMPVTEDHPATVSSEQQKERNDEAEMASRWDLESRRLAGEERHAAAMEAMLQIMLY